jgi:hypothetical protein
MLIEDHPQYLMVHHGGGDNEDEESHFFEPRDDDWWDGHEWHDMACHGMDLEEQVVRLVMASAWSKPGPLTEGLMALFALKVTFVRRRDEIG